MLQVSPMRCSTKASDVNAVPYSCASIAFDSLDGAKKKPLLVQRHAVEGRGLHTVY